VYVFLYIFLPCLSWGHTQSQKAKAEKKHYGVLVLGEVEKFEVLIMRYSPFSYHLILNDRGVLFLP
jgi:hypothetical protein